MARFGDLDTQYFDASGDPLVNGKIYFYESGTTTPKTTFADINSEIPNTNPVLLDASGRQPNIFFEGVAKAILTNNTDVQIVSRDPVGETATNFGDEWVSTRIYGTNDVVIGSDGQYYRSLLTGNQNNNPVTTSGYWSLLYSVEWNAGINYDVGATVTYDTLQYQSIQSGNLNHAPDASPTWWVPLEFVWSATSTYELNQNVVGSDGVLYTSQQASNLNNDPTDAANRPTWWVGTSADAAASAAAAATSEANAATSETNAATSETNAANSATASASSASASAASAASASTAQTAAEAAQTAAETAQTAAETAQTAAETAQTGAETAETNAATSATNSATSASAASASASAASASEAAAATSAANALTSENNASASEAAAATSEANASSSASSASSSAAAASASQSAAATSATSAATSATSAATAEAGAEAALDEFTDIYLGAFASDPTTDNDGDPLAAGMLYYNTSADVLRVYSGTAWQDAGSAVNGTSNRATYTATSGQTTFAIVYDVGFVDVWLNGVKLLAGTDFTATNGTSIVLTTGATLNDLVDIIAFGTFNIANALTTSDLGVTVQAYDATIVVDADIGVTVQAYDADTTKNDVANTFTQNQTFGNGVFIDQNGNGTALNIDSESTTADVAYIGADTITSGRGLYVYSNNASMAGHNVLINVDHASSSGNGLSVLNDGTGDGLLIDQNGNGRALFIDSEATSSQGLYVNSKAQNTYGLQVVADSITVGSTAFFDHKSTSGGNCVYARVDNASSSATGLRVLNSGTGDAVFIDNNGSGNALRADGGNIELTNGQYIEEYNATGTSGAVTIDLDTGNSFATNMAGAVTYTFTNPAASGRVSSFTLNVTNNGSAITWPASVDWPAGTAPTLSASGATDVFVFFTYNAGTTWYGFTAGQGMA